MVNYVDPTFNVLVQLILAGESSESLLEFAEMNGCHINPIDPFGSTTDSSAFVAAKKFLACEYEDFFLPRDESLVLLLAWIQNNTGKDISVTRTKETSKDSESIRVNITLEDNSLLCLKLDYLSNRFHLDRCSVKIDKHGKDFFLKPFVQPDHFEEAQPAAYAFAKAISNGKVPATTEAAASNYSGEDSEEEMPEQAAEGTEQKKSGPQDTTKPNRTVTIKPTDAFVRLQTGNYNHHGHTVEAVNANVTIQPEHGPSQIRTVTAFYCKNCKKYYISAVSYEMLKIHGYICCQVYKQKDIGKDGKVIGSGKKGGRRQHESQLHSYGYNVGQKDNLSITQRQRILRFLVDKKVMNPLEIIDFLEYLIRNAETQTSKNMSIAISRWEEDVKFLEKVIPAKRSVKVKAVKGRNLR